MLAACAAPRRRLTLAPQSPRCSQGYLRKQLSDFSDTPVTHGRNAADEVSLAEEVPPPRYRPPPSHRF